MKKVLFTFILSIFFGSAISQTEISSFNFTGQGYSTATINDYQSLGINPANLGWTQNDHSMNIGFFEFAGSIYSEALTKKQIQNDLFSSEFSLNEDGKVDAAEAFTDAQNFASAAVTWLGFSYQDDKIGGFAVSVRDRIVWRSVLNDEASSFLFLGYNDPYFDSTAYEDGEQIGYSTDPQLASNVYKGTDLHMLLYREINFGYGRKVIKNENLALYLGVNIKYVMGQGMIRYSHDNNGALIGNTSLSPSFGINYESEGIYEGNVNELSGAGLKTVGTGFGFDIGTTLEIKQKLKIALAVNDIGSINWKNNVYEAVDGGVWKVETSGIDNYNIFEEAQIINADHGPPPDDTTLVGIAEKKLSLPTNFRGGLSYAINEFIEVGLDAYVPIGEKVPGNFEAPVFSVGARANPAKWVQLSVGIVNGGQFGTNMPFGVSFFPINNAETKWEIGFATRDMITVFKQTNPTVSYAFGFLRFSFGKKKNSSSTASSE